jgi:hypothetical protein
MSFNNQVFKNTTTGQLFDIFTTPTTDLIPSLDLTNTIPSDMIPSQIVPIVSSYINNSAYTPLLLQFTPSGVILLSPCVATGSVVSFSPFFNPAQFYCDRISGSYTI